MKLMGYSKAGYANWYYIDALRLLWDAGEGVNMTLEGRALRVREIAVTHSHTDHISGLHSLLASRSAELARGKAIEPLRIIYPRGAAELEALLDYLVQATAGFDAIASLHPVEAGEQVVSLQRDDIVMTAVAMHHRDDEPCLGYRIGQRRTKLRPEIAALAPEALRARLAAEGAAALSHDVEVPLLTYSGDGKPLDDPASRGVELLIHDGTFVAPHTSPWHATVHEAIEVARQLEAKRLILVHLSTRYRLDEVRALIGELEREGESLTLWGPGELVETTLEVPGL